LHAHVAIIEIRQQALSRNSKVLISDGLPVASARSARALAATVRHGPVALREGARSLASHILLLYSVDELLESVSHELQVFQACELTFFDPRID